MELFLTCGSYNFMIHNKTIQTTSFIMKSLLTVLLLAVSLPMFANDTTKNTPLVVADAPAWDVDASHSSVNFSVRHFFTPTTGKFDSFEASVNFSPDNLEGSKVMFSIDVASVDTDNEKRDGHLQTADFFDAEKFPKITFESTEFIDKGNGLYHVKGNMTIKDVTKAVEIPVNLLGVKDNPMPQMKGKKVAGFQINTVINRSDYGVGTGNYATDAIIGDDVKVEVFVEAHSK